jgi:hypothetical protein
VADGLGGLAAVRWSGGDTVLLRSMYRGRVRWALPQFLVEETPDHVVLFSPIGTVGRRPDFSLLDYLEQFRTREWSHVEHAWREFHRLRITDWGRAHSLSLLWNADWNFRSWYVDLQEPLRPTLLGFDTQDQALDVVVEPDGSWQWKDEDHLAQLTRLGVFSATESAAIRAEGQRVIAERPWPTGWEDWRPDPTWARPTLPPDWNK